LTTDKRWFVLVQVCLMSLLSPVASGRLTNVGTHARYATWDATKNIEYKLPDYCRCPCRTKITAVLLVRLASLSMLLTFNLYAVRLQWHSLLPVVGSCSRLFVPTGDIARRMGCQPSIKHYRIFWREGNWHTAGRFYPKVKKKYYPPAPWPTSRRSAHQSTLSGDGLNVKFPSIVGRALGRKPCTFT